MKPNKVGISLQNAYAYVLFGSLINWDPSSDPLIVRHLMKRDPERDPNLQNYPHVFERTAPIFGLSKQVSGFGVFGFRNLAFR